MRFGDVEKRKPILWAVKSVATGVLCWKFPGRWNTVERSYLTSRPGYPWAISKKTGIQSGWKPRSSLNPLGVRSSALSLLAWFGPKAVRLLGLDF